MILGSSHDYCIVTYTISNAREETIRVISFDGKATTWPSWKETFLAKAKKKGYKKNLQKKVEVIKETETVPDSDPDKKEKLANRELNENAYADLILSIDATKATGRPVINLIKNTKSDDYSDGHDDNNRKCRC